MSFGSMVIDLIKIYGIRKNIEFWLYTNEKGGDVCEKERIS